MLEAIREALFEEMARDEKVMVIGQDVGRLGGVFRATEGLLDEYGEQRVIDMPPAEAVIAGSALGLAVSGMRPVAEIQFLGFAHQAYHQIVSQLARYRFRTSGRFHLPVTIRAPFGGGVRTPELHADALEAQFTQIPGLKVVVPATAADAKGLLLSAIRDPDPVLFLEPLRGYRTVRDDVPEGNFEVELGRARIARHGADVTILAYSYSVVLAQKAAEIAQVEGISVEVVDLRTLIPLDEETIIASVTKTGRCVIVQEAPFTGGFGSELSATVQEGAFYSLESPIQRVSPPDAPYPIGALEEFYLPDVDDIVAAVRRSVGEA